MGGAHLLPAVSTLKGVTYAALLHIVAMIQGDDAATEGEGDAWLGN